jgi:hypothetical protein
MSRPLNLEHLFPDLGKKETDLIRLLDLLALSTFQRQEPAGFAARPDRSCWGIFGVIVRGYL